MNESALNHFVVRIDRTHKQLSEGKLARELWARASEACLGESLRLQLVYFETAETLSQRRGRRFDPGLVHHLSQVQPGHMGVTQRTYVSGRSTVT
jgi:hypothetical protein